MKVWLRGKQVDWVRACLRMREEVSEPLGREMRPCTPQAFIDEYARLHQLNYGEPFEVD
ncbi:MAG: hypothetical protein ACRC8D_07235 [Aeromonas sp.]